MNRQAKKIIFYIGILLVLLGIALSVLSFAKINIILVETSIKCLVLGLLAIKITYQNYITITRNSNLHWRYKQLTKEELEIVEDAKTLISSVNENITISNFNVYKVGFVLYGWFDYDEDTKELSIFIPFKLFMKFGKDYCFRLVLHEILHSQNLKRNLIIFDIKFLEGLNELLTNWLIEKYSKKYKVPKNKPIVTLKLGRKKSFTFGFEWRYQEEVKMVQDILDKSGIDLKEVFLNYIDINPEFFENFVPEEHFKRQ